MKTYSAKVGDELTSHPFISSLFKLAFPMIANKAVNKTPPPNNVDLYILDLFDAVSPLIQSFEHLERSRSFATLVPSEKYLKGLSINRHDWIEYHISTFLITFVTVDDQALLLVNSVFCLGMDPKHCKADVVKKNKWVKETAIPKCLDSLEKVIKRYRTTRNSLVHRGEIPSLDALLGAEYLDHLKRISFALQHKPEIFPENKQTQVDEAYIKAFTQIGSWMDSEVCQLRIALWQLLTDLHEFYSQRLSLLSSNVSGIA